MASDRIASRNLTSITVVDADISAFDGLTAGVSAPEWLASAVVEAWGFDHARTTFSLISVSENANFLISVDDEPRAVVRLSRPSDAGLNDYIAGELAWVRALERDVQLRLPRFISATNGADEVVLLDDQGRCWHGVATTFVTGRPLEQLADPVPFYKEIGAATAILHRHARAWGPTSGVMRASWTVAEMVGESARWGNWNAANLSSEVRDLIQLAVDVALTVLVDLEKSPETWGLIHADLRPSNILVDPDSSSMTIIDFDDTGFGWYLFDFAAALSFQEHLNHAPAMARAWVEGYREIAPLSDEDLRFANALSLIRRLQMLGWTTTHRPDALPHHLWAQRVSGTEYVARRYLDDQLWLTR